MTPCAPSGPLPACARVSTRWTCYLSIGWVAFAMTHQLTYTSRHCSGNLIAIHPTAFSPQKPLTRITASRLLGRPPNKSRIGLEQGPQELFPGRMLPYRAHRLFPNLLEGDLGTCALVGSGRNLLGCVPNFPFNTCFLPPCSLCRHTPFNYGLGDILCISTLRFALAGRAAGTRSTSTIPSFVFWTRLLRGGFVLLSPTNCSPLDLMPFVP
jgi:hypothetical protein